MMKKYFHFVTSHHWFTDSFGDISLLTFQQQTSKINLALCLYLALFIYGVLPFL